MVKYKLISINILVWVVIVFSLSFTANLHASSSVVSDDNIISKYRMLHAKYDASFKSDGFWATSSNGDYDLYEINFSRWLIKNGHGGELISDDMFDKSSQQYYKALFTWHTLLQTGELTRFGDAAGDYPIIFVTNGITNVRDLNPITWDGKLQNYADHSVKNINGITLDQKDNRVNLLVHNPSLERDNIRRYSGQDAYYTEVLASKSRSIESQIVSYLVDDHNINSSDENGHRFVMLSNNEYSASAHTTNGSNIIVFSNSNECYNFDTLDLNYKVREEIANKYRQNNLSRIHYFYRVNANDNSNLINVPIIGYSKYLKPEGEKKYYQVGSIIELNGEKYEIEKIVKFSDNDIDLLPYGDFVKLTKLTNSDDWYNKASSNVHKYPIVNDATITDGFVNFNGKNIFVNKGVIRTGFINYQGNKFYINPRNNLLLKNWQVINNKLYYFGQNGLSYNKIKNNHWFYFKGVHHLRKTYKLSNGSFAKSQTLKFGKWYYKFDKHGYMYKKYKVAYQRKK